MKARFGTRLIRHHRAVFLLLFGVVTLYLGIRFNGVALNTETVQDLLQEVMTVEKAVFSSEGYWTLRRIMLMGMGARQLIGSLLLFSIPGRMRYKRKDFIVQQTDNGEIRISMRAIENLVRKCTDMHDEIEVSALRISSHRDGVSVDLKASMPNNISIPLAVESLQKQIKQYLTVSSGVNVKTVNVDLADTDAPMQRKSPYDVSGEIAEKQEQKAAHELIFEEEAPAPAEEKQEQPAAEEQTAEETLQEQAAEVQQEATEEAAQAADAVLDEAQEVSDQLEEELAKKPGEAEA